MNAVGIRTSILAALSGVIAGPLSAQAAGGAHPLVGWQDLDAPPGHEAEALERLLDVLPDWSRDDYGNLVHRQGDGRPRRVVACGIDRPGFAVTQITDDGYLRVHRVGNVRHPLWDQAHEGQQVDILTADGVVPGVAAIANGHFGWQHRADTAVVTADDLWMDVGARSREEVEALGIRLLDPLQRRVPAWEYEAGISGPAAGARAGCAAVAAASRGRVGSGETIFLITVESVFGWPGLGAALARLGTVDQVTVLGGGRATRHDGLAPTGASAGVSNAVLRIAGLDSLRVLAPEVRYAGTLVETISTAEAAWLLERTARAAGAGALPRPAWVEIPRRADPSPSRGATPHDELAALLGTLTDLHGASGDEWRVREAVRDALPSWARAAAEVDEAGNLVLAMGPERDTVVFIAHLDEVGWQVEAIASDGTVELRRLGGVIPSAWEGQPALLHLAAGPDDGVAPLPGVFVPRDTARVRQPDGVTAWFGLDAAALAARGVRVGQTVTAYKEAARLAGSRFTGRGMDDRAGSSALVRAAHRIAPAALDRRVIFAWSTEEEVGLVGATALAARLGPTVRRVYSVDTFVSSDTPLESPHFAHAPLGDGPVLRAIENSSISPPAERERVMSIASAAGIPLQIGLTQGGTDGTAFTFWGAHNAGLSWPGRYSHSPAEVLDLADLERLVELIAAVASSR